MTDRPTLGRSALLTAAGLATIGLVRVAAGVLAERRFGPVGLAVFATGIGIATNATIVGAAGFSSGLTKLLAERSDAAADAFRTFASRWLIVMTMIGAFGGAVYARFDPVIDAAPRGTFASVAALAVLFGGYQAGKAVIYGDGHLRSYIRRELVGAFLFMAGAAAALAADNPAVVLMALAAAYMPVALVLIEARPWRRIAEPVPSRAFVQYGIIGSVGSLAGIGFTRLTPIAAGFAAGVAGSAVVGAALVLLEPLYLAPRSIGLALLPRLARDRAEGDMAQASTDIRVATGIVAAATLPFCATLALFPDEITGIIFEEVRGGLTLSVFSAAFLVSVIGAPSITGLSSISPRVGSIAMWSSIAGFVVAIALWFSLGARMGVMAIAIGYLAGSVVQVVAPVTIATRMFQIRWESFPVRLGIAVAVVIAAALTEATTLAVLAVVVAMAAMSSEYRYGLRMLLRPDRSAT